MPARSDKPDVKRVDILERHVQARSNMKCLPNWGQIANKGRNFKFAAWLMCTIMPTVLYAIRVASIDGKCSHKLYRKFVG